MMNSCSRPYWDGWYGDVHAGVDVPPPPWYAAVPITAPLGVAKWGADVYRQNFGQRNLGGSVPASAVSLFALPTSPPSSLPFPWFGALVIVGVGVLGGLLIYSASSTAEKYVAPAYKYAGRAAGTALGVRYGKTSGAAIAALGSGERKALTEGGTITLTPKERRLLTA